MMNLLWGGGGGGWQKSQYFPLVAGPGLFRLHPQKGLNICIVHFTMPSKAGKELFLEQTSLSDEELDTFGFKKA